MFKDRKNHKYVVLTFFLVLTLLMGVACGRSVLPGSDAKPPLDAEDADGVGTSVGDVPSDVAAEPSIELPIGLYMKTGGGKRVLQSQVQADYTVGKDIVVLSAFLTEDPEISADIFKKVWNAYNDILPEASPYKIGYRLSYPLASGDAVEQIIKGPADTEENRNYIETYIYDDVHQDGWYSHLLVSDVRDETVATSLKLTGGPDIMQVGNITVEAFLYKVDESTKNAGTYTVTVVKK